MIVSAVAILRSEESGKFHPIPFQPYFHPADTSESYRIKSIGHHTKGFDTLEEAKTHVVEFPDFKKGIQEFDEIILWDGKTTPALVGFITDGKIIAS